MRKHQHNTTDISERATRQAMLEYFNNNYGLARQSLALSFLALSLSEEHAKKQVEQGDIYFNQQEYTLAAKCYIEAQGVAGCMCPAFCKLGLCIQKGVNIEESGLRQLRLYQQHRGDILSTNELAAVFFREVISLAPEFNDAAYRLKKTPILDVHYSLAIYNLAVCISQGTRICAQDLVNTPYAGCHPQRMDPKEVEMALYQRVLLLNPEHEEAQHRYNRLKDRHTLKTTKILPKSSCDTTIQEEGKRLFGKAILFRPATELNLCDLDKEPLSPTGDLDPSPASPSSSLSPLHTPKAKRGF